jgi:hypothetical protein
MERFFTVSMDGDFAGIADIHVCGTTKPSGQVVEIGAASTRDMARK